MGQSGISGWPPRWLTHVPAEDIAAGDGPVAIDFIESFCRVTKASVAAPAGDLLVLRPWQRQLVSEILARRPDGRRRHRQALIGVPRKSGKSALLSSLTLYLTFMGPTGGETYAVASSKDQARIVFGDAKRMIQMDPELAEGVKLYRDAIEVIENGAIMRVLAAEAPQLEGLSPTAVCYDEVHTAPDRSLWDVLSLAMGARVDPIMVGITTAGVKQDSSGRDSLCYSMYQYGQRIAAGEVEDPAFYMAWWEPRDPQADHRDPATWREANPGIGDISDLEDFESAVLRTPEAEFRTKRCNQWVSTETAWLPSGAWEALADTGREAIPGEDAVLSFDGSFNNDSTALVAWVLGGEKPHCELVQLWEKPADSDSGWSVPVAEVEAAIVGAYRSGRYSVREVVFDPARWMRTMQVLDDEGLPIVSYPNSADRMVPATQRFYEAVLNGSFTHDGNPALARHVANCTTKQSSRGIMVSKANNRRKIDAAVAAIFGYDRATASFEVVDPSLSVW